MDEKTQTYFNERLLRACQGLERRADALERRVGPMDHEVLSDSLRDFDARLAEGYKRLERIERRLREADEARQAAQINPPSIDDSLGLTPKGYEVWEAYVGKAGMSYAQIRVRPGLYLDGSPTAEQAGTRLGHWRRIKAEPHHDSLGRVE